MLATPKHDGVFAHTEGDHLLSRECMPFPGFNEIIKQANHLRQVGGFTFLQGELYDPHQPFQDIQGIVRSSTAPADLKAKIKLHVFNAGGQFKSTRHIFHELRQAVLKAGCDRIEIVESKTISIKGVQSQLDCVLESAIDDGHEGLVLRHLDIEDDRCIGFVKLKPYKECDLIVTDIHEGKGHYQGRAGAITVTGKVDGFNVRLKVPVGHNIDISHRLWNDKNILIDSLIVEVKHSGLNAWPRPDGTYALRDATFIKTKEDRKDLDNG
jgi:ATP-dependent DNA ligase